MEVRRREARELAEKQWREMPEERREVWRGMARDWLLQKKARELGVPPDEFTPPEELVEDIALGMLEGINADTLANISEHVTQEEVRRWATQERERLAAEYPEGVPDDVLAAAVVERMARERPTLP
jgi:hypothetical protein